MRSLEDRSELSLDTPSLPSFPHFFVNGEQMPEIDTWEVGEEYTLKVKVRMTGYSSHMNDSGVLHSSADFDMLSYDVVKK